MVRKHRAHSFWTALLWWALGCSGSSQPEAAPGAAPVVAPAQTVVVRIGYQRTGAPFLLKTRAQNLEQKLTAAHASLEWVEFQSGPPILEAMRAGAVDVGYTGETPPVFGQSGGVPFVYVASDAPAPEAEAIVVPSGSKVQTVAELKGKRVALNRGSNVHYLLLRALESAGLTLNDIEFLPLPPPDARAVFDSGKLDAWVIWDPYLAAAELAGARVLKDGRDLVDNRFFYLARREFAEKHAEQLKIVMDAFGEVGSWSGEHREDSARLQSEATGVAYEALLKAERRHVYRVDPITPAVIAKQQAIGDAFHALGVIPTAVRAEQASLLAGAK